MAKQWARLGNVALDFIPWEFPAIQRGFALPVARIAQGRRRLAQLAALPLRTRLTISSPEGVRSLLVVKLWVEPSGPNSCVVVLTDERWMLTRGIVHRDFSVRLADQPIDEGGVVSLQPTYLEDTATAPDPDEEEAGGPYTVEEALTKLTDNLAALGIVAPIEFTAAARKIAAANRIPDNLLVAGMPPLAALSTICSPIGLDLYVSQTPIAGGFGGLVLTDRDPTTPVVIPSTVAWVERNPHLADRKKRSDRPATFIFSYLRREELAAEHYNDGDSRPIDEHLSLRQRYPYDGRWWPLKDLCDQLDATKKLGVAVTEALIAQNFYSAAFGGTALSPTEEAQPMIDGLTEVSRRAYAATLLPLIAQHWRRSFLVASTRGGDAAELLALEGQGHWTDVAFGRFDLDSEDVTALGGMAGIEATSIKAVYTEVYRRPLGIVAGIAQATDRELQDIVYTRSLSSFAAEDDEGNGKPAPFTVRWLDRKQRILSLSAHVSGNVADVRIGDMEHDEHLIRLDAAADAIEGLDREHAGEEVLYIQRSREAPTAGLRPSFETNYRLSISFLGTRRWPEDRNRFHEVEAPAFDDGEGVQFVPVDAGAFAHFTTADLVTPANEEGIAVDVERRRQRLLREYGGDLAFTALAQGLTGLDIPVRGALAGVAIEFGSRGLATVLTRVQIGSMVGVSQEGRARDVMDQVERLRAQRARALAVPDA